jgi:hypothetical protein
LKSLENGKKREEAIRILKCADGLVLLAKGETILLVTIDELVEVGRRYRMENGEKQVMRISRRSSAVQTMVDQKRLENVECEVFQLFW